MSAEEVTAGTILAGKLANDPLISAARVRLNLPYDRPPPSLWANTRAHWRRRHVETARLRADVVTVARAAGLHRLCDGRVSHVTAQLTWAPGDRRRRDADNLAPMQKVVCDGIARGRSDLVGLDLVPDDTPEWMEKLAPRILPPPEPPGLWLDLTLRFRET